MWSHSSVGRAPALQAGGHWFEPSCDHHLFGGVAQLVRVLACHARCREFESRHFRHYAQIAQSVEQGTENPCVRGSIPRLGTIFKTKYILLYEIQFVRDNKLYFLLITEYKLIDINTFEKF